MSLNKAIKFGKEHRKKYRGAKAVSWSCCNHGSCSYCYDTRTWKERQKSKEAKKEVLKYEV